LFALKALLDLEVLNSNNVRGGTCLAEAGGAKKSGWAGGSSIEHRAVGKQKSAAEAALLRNL